MSLSIQIVIPTHLSVEDVCRVLREGRQATQVKARPARRPEHWIVEYVDANGEPSSLDAFLQSYAADDYRGLTDGPSTLLCLPYDPSNQATARGLADTWSGWFRFHEGVDWQPGKGAETGLQDVIRSDPSRH